MFNFLSDPLGMMVVLFIAAALVGVTGIVFIFLAKSERLKKLLVYFLAGCGLILALVNILSTPETAEFIGAQLGNFAVAALAIGGILVNMCWKNEKSFPVARILVVLSVLAGLVGFLI